MKHLIDYIYEQFAHIDEIINEGGQAGHMPHPYDYTDFTGNDLKDIVISLFSGKIEHLKEKLDGFNIMATMNEQGEVVFIRNQGNLNSEKGGMTLDEMEEKYKKDDKDTQAKVFVGAGKIIIEVFNKLGKTFFNPSKGVRKIVNCECIVKGDTNIMIYKQDRVAFHGYHIYKLNEETQKWILDEDVEGHVDDIYKAAEGIDAAKPRPDLIIKSAEKAQKFSEQFAKDLDKLFADDGLTPENTIEEWKIKRFNKIKPEWLPAELEEPIFNRWFNDDKSFKAAEIKKVCPEHYDELKDDKFKKPYVGEVMRPIDNLFLKIGNELIDLLQGFTNSKTHDEVVYELQKNVKQLVQDVKEKGSTEQQEKVEIELRRLQSLGDKYNSAEGIVFVYKGRRMKLTGSFAAINQLMGVRYALQGK